MKNKEIETLIQAVAIAQTKGCYTLEESALLYSVIQKLVENDEKE